MHLNWFVRKKVQVSQTILIDRFVFCSQECLTTGFRFSVTHDDPPFVQSEPRDERFGSSGDEPPMLLQQQRRQDGNPFGGVGGGGGGGGIGSAEKPVTCDYLSPYAFTARNSLGSTSGTYLRTAHLPLTRTTTDDL